MPFQDLPEGKTHSFGDGCPEHPAKEGWIGKRLANGMILLVDVKDAPLIMERRWYAWKRSKTWYATRKENKQDGVKRKDRKQIHLHREILGVPPEGMVIDHINRNGLDNRRSNLRFATFSENNLNTGMFKSNTSGVKNIELHKTTGKWRVRLRRGGKEKSFGYFSTKELAIKRLNEILYGE